MLESPPAIVMALPDVPAGFSIEDMAGADESYSLLRQQPECLPSSADEIVVCARRDDSRYRLGPALPDTPTAMDQINSSLSTRLGPVEVGSLRQRDGSYSLGLRIRF